MNIRRNLVTVAATGALLLGAFATPAFAATSITVSGNGSSSTNDASVTSSHSTTVVQSNDTSIHNSVDNTSNTGGNSASDNTGGDVLVATGNASSTTNISNKANLNQATLNNCGCTSSADVKVSGNGTDSTNTASLTNSNTTSSFQDNTANISNKVSNHLDTGDNNADDNTAGNGGGTVTVITGDATSHTHLTTDANANILSNGSGSGSGGGSMNATISGNGSSSDSSIALDASNDTTAVQSNIANIRNSVRDYLETGDNSASDNTGSNVGIGTGNANSAVAVDNMANFNAADLSACGCMTDTTAKVSGNGTDSSNTITASMGGDLSLFQGGLGGGNSTYIDNYLHSNGKTGYNWASDNTGPVVGDPVTVLTGDSNSNTTVSNQGGENLFGSLSGLQLPGGLSFTFDLSSLMGSF